MLCAWKPLRHPQSLPATQKDGRVPLDHSQTVCGGPAWTLQT